MVSFIDNNGYILYDPSNIGQTTTTTQNPSIDYYHHQHSPFTPSFEAFVGSGNSVMTNKFLLEHQAGSCSNMTWQEGGGTEEEEEEVPRKRSTKDRHKKIQTANGLRARRMRLSTVVAQKFFHLQDLLGFDKGSMTIAWLLSVSEASITQLIGRVAAPRHGGDQEHGHVGNEMVELEAQEGTAGVRRTRRRPAKIVQRPMRTKESRNEARRRARERTMTKRRNMRSGSAVGVMPGASCHRQVGSYGTSQETQEDLCPNRGQETRLDVEEERQEQEHGLLSDIDFLECQMDALRSIEKFLGIDSDSSSSSISGDSTGKNSEEPRSTVLPGNWSTRVSDGAQSENPNLDGALASLAQKPNVSTIIPMAAASSTMSENQQTTLPASTNHPCNRERNYNSSWSVFEHLY